MAYEGTDRRWGKGSQKKKKTESEEGEDDHRKLRIIWHKFLPAKMEH